MRKKSDLAFLREEEEAFDLQYREAFDLERRDECEAAVAFRDWIGRLFPDILENGKSAELDVAQLRIAQEYNLRRRGHRTHRLDRCLLDVFHEWMDLLWDRQRSVAQRRIYPEPPAPKALTQALYLGDEEQGLDGAESFQNSP